MYKVEAGYNVNQRIEDEWRIYGLVKVSFDMSIVGFDPLPIKEMEYRGVAFGLSYASPIGSREGLLRHVAFGAKGFTHALPSFSQLYGASRIKELADMSLPSARIILVNVES